MSLPLEYLQRGSASRLKFFVMRMGTFPVVKAHIDDNMQAMLVLDMLFLANHFSREQDVY